jgi:DUF1680 family protein
MYLLTAVADLVRLDESHKIADTSQLKVAMYRLWDNMVNCKMYVTGGMTISYHKALKMAAVMLKPAHLSA